MKIQSINNNCQKLYNPNMKALYFTKVAPTSKFNYPSITETGIKYIEDNSAKLTPIMKEALEENRFIKKLAEKYDTFVQYIGTKFDSAYKNFKSETLIHIVNPEKTTFNILAFRAEDKFSPEGSRLKLLSNIEQEEYYLNNTCKLDTFVF